MSDLKGVTREYTPVRPLKYGCNPHQKPAAIYTTKGEAMPFEILNGNPGYINLLDALNSWQLVLELSTALDLPAAASFKHVSPAGAAVFAELNEVEKEVYSVTNRDLSEVAVAYVRARNADPKSSFGDFAAVSQKVDVTLAKLLKREVSDGIIAPDFEPEALEMLKSKKKGGYIILKANPAYKPPQMEYREVFGVTFAQKRNDTQLTREHVKNVVTANKELTDAAVRDMLVASIAIKYTQSNSVGYALNGQMIGVGAGQQSRVDCVKMAGSKVETWWMRTHPKVRAMKFKPKTKLLAKLNARIQYIESDMTPQEKEYFDAMFEEVPLPITAEERAEHMATLTGVTLSSDAFFPFRDNIDWASKKGVTFIVQPGGSVQDEVVAKACDQYNMVMCHTGVRLFHH